MLFRTTSRVDLPHYSYIFTKPDPLGTEMKNVACSRLGAIVAPRDTKGGGGYKDVGISKMSQRYGCVHEETINRY